MLFFIKLKSCWYAPKCTIKRGLVVMKNELIMHNCVTFRINPLPITLDTANCQRLEMAWVHTAVALFQSLPTEEWLWKGPWCTDIPSSLSLKKNVFKGRCRLYTSLPIFIQVSHSLFPLHFHKLHFLILTKIFCRQLKEVRRNEFKYGFLSLNLAYQSLEIYL